jgi:hypothetical protein
MSESQWERISGTHIKLIPLNHFRQMGLPLLMNFLYTKAKIVLHRSGIGYETDTMVV